MRIRSLLIGVIALTGCASKTINSPKNAKSQPLWECVAEGVALSQRKEYLINAASEEIAVTATQAALVVNGHMSGMNERMSPDVSCKQTQVVN
jgi:hypothetical protein